MKIEIGSQELFKMQISMAIFIILRVNMNYVIKCNRFKIHTINLICRISKIHYCNKDTQQKN